MRHRSLLCACTLVATVGVTAPASAQAPRPGERIAPGVSAGGVDLSNLLLTEAEAKLEAVRPALERPITVQRAGKTFKLTAKKAKQKFDVQTTAKRALYAGRAKAQTPPPSPGAAVPGVNVPLAVSHSKAAVQGFAARVDRELSVTGKDAKLLISLRRVKVTGSRNGRTIDGGKLAAAINAALPDPASPRVLKPELIRTKAARTYQDMRKRASTVITIDRNNFKLRLFKNLKVVKTYGVAVGQPAYPTPTGLFAIQSKQVNPTWSVPNSPWAGELGGTTVVGGSAANPLKARWMGVSGSVGIHGTGEDYSIGSRASHGCIRMHVGDVIALYKRVPIGTPVLIR